MLRGGFGLFYDLGYGDTGFAALAFPYLRFEDPSVPPGLAFDLTNPIFQPPPFSTAITKSVFYLTQLIRVCASRSRCSGMQRLNANWAQTDTDGNLRWVRRQTTAAAGCNLYSADFEFDLEPVYATRNAGHSH